MKKLCRTCFYWHQRNYDYYTPGGEVYGKCSCGKFIYRDDSCSPYATDQLIYWDYGGYSAGVAIGPEFGCVHWRRKEEEEKK